MAVFSFASSSRSMSRQPLHSLPEEDSDMDESEFETLPMGNLLPKPRSSRRLFPAHSLSRARPRATLRQALKRLLLALLVCLGILKLASLSWATLVHFFPDDLDARLDAWVYPGGRPSPFSHWTTYGVLPVQCHSHNDYWREVPLFSALRAGCVGVEADIWPSNNDLLVGHNPYTLHAAQTLRTLYLDPLLDLLYKHNTRTSQLQDSHSTPAGIFANDPSQTLVLLIDFKTPDESLYHLVNEHLQPLREAGYLTHFNGSAVIQRPLTVVATGDVAFNLLTANKTHRDIFYDAPLASLTSFYLPPSFPSPPTPEEEEEEEEEKYTVSNSYYASTNFKDTIGHLARNRFSKDQLAQIRVQVEAAHSRGLKVRYWGTPNWPRGLRNHVWHVLVREGVDLINVDDLEEATRQDWRKHRSWLF